MPALFCSEAAATLIALGSTACSCMRCSIAMSASRRVANDAAIVWPIKPAPVEKFERVQHQVARRPYRSSRRWNCAGGSAAKPIQISNYQLSLEVTFDVQIFFAAQLLSDVRRSWAASRSSQLICSFDDG